MSAESQTLLSRSVHATIKLVALPMCKTRLFRESPNNDR